MSLRIGIDIGGTFTDLVAISGDGVVTTHKTASTPHDYGEGIIEGLRALLADRPGPVADVLHATTVGSNTVLERKGAKTALITTRGFRDILEIRDLRMPVLYDIGWTKPRALVERRLRLEVTEKLRPDGSVAVPLDAASLEPVIAMLRAENVASVAICLLHSYANPAHERAVALAVRDGVAGGGDFRQQRHPAGDQGISAHQHDGHQRLCATRRAGLHHRAGCPAARAWDRCAAATDAVQRRAGFGVVRGGIAGPHHRIRAGRGCRRGRRAGATAGRAADRYVRHGRNDRQGRTGRERRGSADRGDRGRRRGDGRVAAAGGRRLHAEAAGDRSGGGRGRRRIDLPAGQRRGTEGRTGKRGGRAGAGLLRSRRRRADDHRLQSGAGVSRSRRADRGDDAAGSGGGACGDPA